MNSAKTDVPQVPMGTVPPLGGVLGGRAGTVQAALPGATNKNNRRFWRSSCDILKGGIAPRGALLDQWSVFLLPVPLRFTLSPGIPMQVVMPSVS
jgi:hypothetical protein